jgi:hypothetical protein
MLPLNKPWHFALWASSIMAEASCAGSTNDGNTWNLIYSDQGPEQFSGKRL